MGDLHVDLPNGSKRTQITFKNAIHAPDMAFTLISISRLDKANIATIPHSEGLYRIIPSKTPTGDQANAATGKMDINEAHRKRN